jgi:hypothetical protein
MRAVFVCLLSSTAFGQFGGMSWQMDGDVITVKMGPPSVWSQSAITGAPFSGEMVSERVQTLGNGIHIKSVPQNTKRTWRDSQGRERVEQLLTWNLQPVKGGEYVLAMISDPVAGCTYLLDDTNKIAHRYAITAPPALRQAATASAAPQHRWSSEDLGTQSMEGLTVEGTRQTNTTPVGEVGNDQPIVSTSEFWYSKELRITVLSKDSDPRSGDNTTRFINVSRAEPEASLLTVPDGYTVVDGKESITVTVRKQ